MPKVSWSVEKPRYLSELFRRYKKAQSLNSADIGRMLGVTADNVRAQMNKPTDKWRISELKRYCGVLNIPFNEALNAIDLEVRR